MPSPGYLPNGKDGPPTLAKLPLADLLNVISQAKMPASNNACDVDGLKPTRRPLSAAPARQRPGSRGRVSRCPTREDSPRDGSGSRPNSARPSSASRPSSGSRPNSARPPSARDPAGQPEFYRHVSRGKPFSPRVDFLEAKVVGNGSQWDQERLLMPERAYPCISKGAADYHDRNAERENRPPWKPTIANRVSGMGVQTDAAFPLPHCAARPMSARPSSARPHGRPLSARPVNGVAKTPRLEVLNWEAMRAAQNAALGA